MIDNYYLSVFSLVLQDVFTFDVLVGCIVDRIVCDLTIKATGHSIIEVYVRGLPAVSPVM